ncbi:MAG: hypothetical protein ACK568_07395, partial [Pseudanabaena sp.]
ETCSQSLCDPLRGSAPSLASRLYTFYLTVSSMQKQNCNSLSEKILRDLRLIKVPTASTSLSQCWLSEVEAIQTRWYFFLFKSLNAYFNSKRSQQLLHFAIT